MTTIEVNVHKKGTNNRAPWLCVAAAVIGVLYSLIQATWFPGRAFAPASAVPSSQLRLIAAFVKIGNWPWAIITIAVLIVFVVWRRFQGRSWILAAVAGVILGHLAARALR